MRKTRKELKAIIKGYELAIEEVFIAYPEDIFPDTTQEERDVVIKKYPGFIDRTSAKMGRHLAKVIKETIEYKEHYRNETAINVLIIGDIIELPAEAQYTTTLELRKKWLEVTDVTWDVSSYTPGWQPTMLKITATPARMSQET